MGSTLGALGYTRKASLKKKASCRGRKLQQDQHQASQAHVDLVSVRGLSQRTDFKHHNPVPTVMKNADHHRAQLKQFTEIHDCCIIQNSPPKDPIQKQAVSLAQRLIDSRLKDARKLAAAEASQGNVSQFVMMYSCLNKPFGFPSK